jgi:uncharacterized protein YggT (Ycf19 family)
LLLEVIIFVRAALFWIQVYCRDEQSRIVGGVLLGVLVAFFTGGVMGIVTGVAVAVLVVVNPGLLMEAVQPLSEPFLKPFRRLVPPWRMRGLDLSPIFALLALEFIRKFLIPTLFELSARLR